MTTASNLCSDIAGILSCAKKKNNSDQQSNFSLQHRYIVNRTGVQNNENNVPRNNVLLQHQISKFLRSYVGLKTRKIAFSLLEAEEFVRDFVPNVPVDVSYPDDFGFHLEFFISYRSRYFYGSYSLRQHLSTNERATILSVTVKCLTNLMAASADETRQHSLRLAD